ncbi:MAG: UbiD family decarboxylase [Nitrososphaeria archaeon]
MPKNLKTYLREVYEKLGDEFLYYNDQVDPKYGITGLVEKFEDLGKFPVLYFSNVKGSNIPVITNIISTEKRAILALDLKSESNINKISEIYNRQSKVKETSEAPVQTKVIKNETPLSILPKIYHNELDGGPYISSGLVILRDLDGKLNMGIYRIQVFSDNKLGIMTNPHSDANHIISQYRQAAKPLPITISIGHHPAVYMAAVTRPSGMGGELELAGGLLGESLRITAANTVNLPVLTDAELAIEGVIKDPAKLVDEGPFGEWPGYYSGTQMVPLIDVTALSMREHPIYYDIPAARREHLLLGLFPHEITVYQRIKADVQDLVDLYLPFSGSHRAICYLSIAKHNEGQPIRAGMMAVTAYPSVKIAIVVDNDIDVKNEAQVLWAVYTRVRSNKQILVIPDVEAHHLNPSTYNENGLSPGNMEVKLVIDATKPLAGFAKTAKVPFDIKQNIDISLLKKIDVNIFDLDD